MTYIDEQAKDDPPVDAHENVQGPVDKGAREGDEQQQREEYAQGGHHLGVDEAAESPRAGARSLVQVLAVDAGDDGGKDELRGAKDEADDAIDSHGCEMQ